MFEHIFVLFPFLFLSHMKACYSALIRHCIIMIHVALIARAYINNSSQFCDKSRLSVYAGEGERK